MSRKPRGTGAALLALLSFVLLFTPLGAQALGLGKLKIHSALNEPLNGEIDFTSISEKELKGLKVSLGTRQDFQSVGATRLPFYSNIKFKVSKRADGRYFLLLQTQEQVLEPFIHIVIRLEWPGAQVVREYSALIDPPQYLVGKPVGVEAPVTTPASIEPIPVAEPAKPAPPIAEAAPPQAPMAEPVPPVADTTTPPPEAVAAVEPLPEPKTTPEPVGPPEPAASYPADDYLLGPGSEPKVKMDSSGWPVTESRDVARVEPLPEPAMDVIAPHGAPLSTTTAYKVKRGDTLWEIAERVRREWKGANRVDPSVVTTEQLVMAIFNNNQHAFFRSNVNNMYAGKVLTIPEPETTQEISRQAARKEFRAQYDVWQEYKLKLASASRAIEVTESAQEAAAPAEPVKQAAAKKDATPKQPPAKEEAKADTTPAPVAGSGRGKQPEELLKIVRATLEKEKTAPTAKVAEAEASKTPGAKEQTALAERVTTLEESLESKKAETKEMQEKVGQVREQIEKQSRLMEIENQQLAQQTGKPAPESSGEAPKTETPAPAPKPEATPKAAEATKAAPVQKAPPAPKKATPPPPPPEEKGMLASVMDAVGSDSVFPVIGGIVAIAGGAILLIYLRRRQRSIAEFEESILAADAISTEAPLTGDTGGQQAVAAGDTSFLSDFSQGGMGNIHTDEVDPVAEAEVYLAYGRDETAEEILKDAIVKHPDRQELKLKLLEIYSQRNDVNAFETLAEELYATLGGRGGKVWDKVADMGRKLNPNNPMFRGGAPAPGAKTMAAATAGSTTVLDTTASPTAKTPTDVTDSALNMDFSVGGAKEAKTAGEEAGLDFDFEAKTPGGDTSVEFEVPSAAPPAEDKGDGGIDSLDFGEPSDTGIDFESGGGAEVEPESVASADDTAVSGGEINWDFEAPAAATAEPVSEVVSAEVAAGGGEEGQAQWDETATKLDLAKAYIDMGDSEGARSILDEVLSEGNASQKKEAAELAAQIG